jgi:hypothetical protein
MGIRIHIGRARPASLSTSRRLLPACMDSVRPALPGVAVEWSRLLNWTLRQAAGPVCRTDGATRKFSRKGQVNGEPRLAGRLGGFWLHL